MTKWMADAQQREADAFVLQKYAAADDAHLKVMALPWEKYTHILPWHTFTCDCCGTAEALVQAGFWTLHILFFIALKDQPSNDSRSSRLLI